MSAEKCPTCGQSNENNAVELIKCPDHTEPAGMSAEPLFHRAKLWHKENGTTRVYEISGSDPIPWRILDGYAKEDQGPDEITKLKQQFAAAQQEIERLRTALTALLNAEWMVSTSWTSPDKRYDTLAKARAALEQKK